MLRTRQHEWMDEWQVPWVLDPELGPMLAGRTADGDVGDGAYVYRAGCEAPQPTTTPERAARLFAEREREYGEAVARLRAAVERSEIAIVAPAETAKETVAKKAPLEEDPELESCTIQRRARPGGGRADVTIVTPDGQRFRSKAAALRHLSDLST